MFCVVGEMILARMETFTVVPFPINELIVECSVFIYGDNVVRYVQNIVALLPYGVEQEGPQPIEHGVPFPIDIVFGITLYFCHPSFVQISAKCRFRADVFLQFDRFSHVWELLRNGCRVGGISCVVFDKGEERLENFSGESFANQVV